MKRINFILSLSLSFILFLISSCSLNSSSNSIAITLPVINSSANRSSREGISVSYNFVLKLEDSESNIHELAGSPGDTVYFEEIPIGSASIEVTGYDSANVACYYGKTDFEVQTGENFVTITLRRVEAAAPNQGGDITITINANGTVAMFTKTSETTVADFLTVLSTAKSSSETTYKNLYAWKDTTTNAVYDFDETNTEKIAEYFSGLTEDTTIVGMYGVEISTLKTYLSNDGTGASDGEEIVVIGDSTTTKIPAFNFSSPKYTDITLDFSRCNNVITVDTNAITGTNAGQKWVSVLKLPASMNNICYIQGVKDEVHIPALDTLKFNSNTTSTNSSYSIYYNGTLADWAAKLDYGSSYSNNPIENISKNDKDFYAMVDGVSTNIIGTDIELESNYIDSQGETKSLSKIVDYAFRFLKCDTIKIPASVETIGASAFAWSDAEEVYIENGLKRIDSGALYYPETYNSNPYSPRIIYFNGTIDEWMKIGCETSNTSGEGGPFLGKNTDLYIKNGAGYTPAISSGTLEVTVEKSTVTKGNSTASYFGEISGQLQGLQGLQTVKIFGTPAEGEKFTIEEYAFYDCSNLTEVSIDPAVDIGANVFKNTALSNLYLNGSIKSTCTSTSFSGTSGVTLHVPAALYSAYREDSLWPTVVSDISTEIELNINGTTRTVTLNGTTGPSDFSVATSECPSGKELLYYIDSNNNIWDFTETNAMTNFKANLPSDGKLTAVFGLPIENLSTYLLNTITTNENLVLKNSSSVTTVSISGIKSGVDGIILDLSNCTSVTSFEIDPTTNQIGTIKFPTSINNIGGIKAVKDVIYIPYTTGSLSFGTNTYDASTTYEITFNGTLADWCSKDESEAVNFPSKYLKYCLNSEGELINIQSSGLIFENTCTSGSPFTEIATYNFANLQCNSSDFTITIPDSVETIGSYAFYNVEAMTVNIGSGIQRIGEGALFSRSNNDRTVNYKGSINDWIKINCPIDDSYGPLYGVSDFNVYNGSAYVPAIESGVINIYSNDDLTLEGQLQGLTGGFNTLKIEGTMDTITIEHDAFLGCDDLTDIYINTDCILMLGARAFDGLNGTTIHLKDAQYSLHVTIGGITETYPNLTFVNIDE